MYDGGLPFLPCLPLDGGNKPTHEYSSHNHNNELHLFTNVPAQKGAGVSIPDFIPDQNGNGNKNHIAMISEAVRSASFLRQQQIGSLESFEISYVPKSFSHSGSVQPVKDMPSNNHAPLKSLKEDVNLFKSVLSGREGAQGGLKKASDFVRFPSDVINILCSKEPADGRCF